MEELLLLYLYYWNRNRNLSLAITRVKHVSSQIFQSRSIVQKGQATPRLTCK